MTCASKSQLTEGAALFSSYSPEQLELIDIICNERGGSLMLLPALLTCFSKAQSLFSPCRFAQNECYLSAAENVFTQLGVYLLRSCRACDTLMLAKNTSHCASVITSVYIFIKPVGCEVHKSIRIALHHILVFTVHKQEH